MKKAEKNSNKTEQKAKPAEKWATKFFLTANRPNLTELIMLNIIAKTPCEVIGYKIAYEVGEKGNLHLHLYLRLARSVRLTWFFRNFPGVETVTVTPGTEADVISYIGNHDKEVSKGCTVLPEYTHVWGDIEGGQGERTDLTTTDRQLWEVKEAVDGGATVRELFDTYFPLMIRYGRSILEYRNLDEETKKQEEASRIYEIADKRAAILLEELEAQREIIKRYKEASFEWITAIH